MTSILLEIRLKSRKKLDPSSFIRRTALDKDYNELIKENVIVYEDDNPVIVYIIAKEIPQKYVETVKSIKYAVNKRLAGLVTRSKIFGYMPREQVRKDFCSSTSFSVEDPDNHKTICDFGKEISKYYRKYCPEMFHKHKVISTTINPEWKIEDTPFTSGVINQNNMLKYHYDGGNVNDIYSNMVAFKKHCVGGHLSIPEFDIGLDIADRSLLFFDGQDIIHGVTPFKITRAEGYRYTIVYYTLQRMWQCKPISEEIARIKKRKTEREFNRYQRLTGLIPNEIQG